MAAQGCHGRTAMDTGEAMAVKDGDKEPATQAAVIAGAAETAITLVSLLTGESVLLLADFLKTGLEFFAVLLAWLAVRRLGRADGLRHDYGIGKIENLSSLVIAVLMMATVIVITISALFGLLWPSPVAGVGVKITVASLVIYAGINGWLWRRCRAASRAEDSPLMASQAKLFLTKLFGNVFMLAALCSSLWLIDQPWAHYIDPLAALAVAASILMSALGVFSSSVYHLLDGTLEESDKLAIMGELARHFERYDWLYGVRSRRSGNHVFVEIELGFDAARRVGEVEPHIAVIRDSVTRLFRQASVTVALGHAPGEARRRADAA